MRKIISGMLGIVMTASIVGGVAYAAFSTTATVHGLSIAAGTASLFVGPVGNATTNDFDANVHLTGVFPGFGAADDQHADFDIKNNSDGFPLTLSAKLTAANGFGSGLENYVLVAINVGATSDGTGYHTLAEWNSGNGFPLTGGALNATDTRTYRAYVKVDPAAPNSIQGQAITDIVYTITGTQ